MANKSNSVEKLIKLKDEFNNGLDKKINEMKLAESKELVDSLSVNGLIEMFNAISDRLFETKEGKNIIKKFANTIKESTDLKLAYGISNQIKKPVNVNDTDSFVLTAFKLMEGIDKERLEDGRNVLSKVIREAVDMTVDNSDEMYRMLEEYKSNTLNEAIDYILSNKATVNKMPEFSNAIHSISSYINENKVEKTNDVETCKVTDIKEKLDESDMSEWERKAVEKIAEYTINGQGKEALFENLKEQCINVINENLESCDIEEKSRLEGMKEKLSSKKFVNENANDDILRLSELHYTLTR